MDRQPVSSSNIASIGHEGSTDILEVEFHKSGVYRFFNVPAAVYDALMAAPSHGVFFNANIKGQFAYERA